MPADATVVEGLWGRASGGRRGRRSGRGCGGGRVGWLAGQHVSAPGAALPPPARDRPAAGGGRALAFARSAAKKIAHGPAEAMPGRGQEERTWAVSPLFLNA